MEIDENKVNIKCNWLKKNKEEIKIKNCIKISEK